MMTNHSQALVSAYVALIAGSQMSVINILSQEQIDIWYAKSLEVLSTDSMLAAFDAQLTPANFYSAAYAALEVSMKVYCDTLRTLDPEQSVGYLVTVHDVISMIEQTVAESNKSLHFLKNSFSLNALLSNQTVAQTALMQMETFIFK
ncbi:MAG: hypothetical protein ACRCXZ_02780 [Patescibacteria group bacterium]